MTLLAGYWHLIFIIAGFLAAQVVAFVLAQKWVISARNLITSVKTHPLSPTHRDAATKMLPWLNDFDDLAGDRGISQTARAHAIFDLESSIEDKWSFAILHRAAVLAPLLGVLITSGEFLRMGLREQDDKALHLATLVLPLILGVGSGAMLAAINQMLLMLLDRTTATMLSAARRWLQGFESDFEKSNRTSRVQYSELTSVIREHMEAMRENATAIVSTSSMLEVTSRQLSDFGRSLSESVSRVPSTLSAIADAADRSTSALGRAIETNCQLSDRLDNAVTRFESCVVENLVPAAERQDKVSRGMNSFITDADNLRDTLAAAARELSATIANQKELSGLIRGYFVEDARGHSEQMAVMDSHVDDALRRMAELSTQLHVSIELITKEVASGGEAFSDISQIATNFERVIQDELRPSFVACREMTDTLSAISRDAYFSMSELSKAVPQFRESVEIQRESIEQFRDNVRDLTVPTHQSLSRAAKVLDVGSEDLSDSISRFREFLALMAGEVKRVIPAIENTVQSLNPAALGMREAIEDHLKPSLGLQETLLRTQSEAIVRLTNQLKAFEAYTASLVVEANGRHNADIDVGEATRSLHNTTKELAKLVANGLAPAQHDFADAVSGLGQSLAALQQLLANGTNSLDKEIRDLNQVVRSVASLLTGLQSVSQLADPSAKPQQLLTSLEAVTEALDTLPLRIADAIAKSAAKHDNGTQRGFFSNWFQR